MLKATHYDHHKTKYLIDGFRNGFDIGYRGPVDRRDISNNIPITIGSEREMWNKIMKEIRMKRYAGPFDEIPFTSYIQSPIGLVPKGADKTRLIFHLSYNFGPEVNQKSVNYHTPKHLCKVKYPDLDHAINNCLRMKDELLCEMEGIFGAKTDLVSAFRQIPCRVDQRKWLVMKAKNPITKKIQFMIDNCLPFGGSRSCNIFQEFSCALKHLAEKQYGRPFTVTNYLDDFFFVEENRRNCNLLVRVFLNICERINCPVSQEKTEFATQQIVFLGILLNLKEYYLAVPHDKLIKALTLLKFVVNKKKITIKFIQRLTGTLNFLSRAIVPGRAFTRRMYTKLTGIHKHNLKAYHHVSLDREFLDDCSMWIDFLTRNQITIFRPFIDYAPHDYSETIQFYTDASKTRGFGCFFNGRWTFSKWENNFVERENPSIDFLELYALCVAVAIWSNFLANRRVTIFCDNQGVMGMINKTATGGKNSMNLIRRLVLSNLKNNTRIKVEFIKSEDNILADSLSRFDFDRFWKHAPKNTLQFPDGLPQELWPLSKIWEKE